MPEIIDIEKPATAAEQLQYMTEQRVNLEEWLGMMDSFLMEGEQYAQVIEEGKSELRLITAIEEVLKKEVQHG